jgi:deazaflavin-dependent oxidoreductase (nitroreductase family)
MRLPKWLARFNKHVTNRVSGMIAPRVRPFATVVHRGRRSGGEYRTTIMGWVEGGALTVALTYGPEVDWLKNLQAANGGEVLWNGRELTVGRPVIVDPEVALARIPNPVAPILRRLHLEDFAEIPVHDSRPQAPD